MHRIVLVLALSIAVAAEAQTHDSTADTTLLAKLQASAPGVGRGAERAYTFAGLPWGSSRAECRALLAKQGFAYSNTDTDGDMFFTGTALSYTATIIVMFNPDAKAVKVISVIATPDSKARSVYDDMKQTLSAKYGRPAQSLEHFDPPYEADDGYADQAIRMGKGHFLTLWPTQAGTQLGLEISDRLTVDVVYEGPEFAAEAARRKALQTKIF